MSKEELITQRNEALKYIDKMYNFYNKDFFDKEIKFLWKYEIIIGCFDDKKRRFIEIQNDHGLNIRMITDYCIKIQKFYEKCDKEGYICYEHFAEGALNSYFMNLFMYKFGNNFDYVWDYIESHIMSDNISYDKVLVEVTDFYLDLLNKKYDK